MEVQDPVIRPLQFADRGTTFPVLGDTGLNRWGGYIQNDDPDLLQGLQWIRMIRRMLTSPIVKGMLFSVEMLIRRAEWSTEPAIDGGTEAQEVADFVESARHDMRVPWEDTLAQILSFLPYGYSLHEIVYKRRLGDQADPGSSSDDGRIGWDEWSPRPQDTIQRWEFNDRGHVIAYVQQTPHQTFPITIPLSKSLHFKASTYKANPEGESVLRSAYTDWDAINKLQLVEAIGIERDMAGLPVAMIPPRFMAKGRAPEETAFYNAVKNIVTGVRQNDQAGVVFPLEYDAQGKPMYEFKLLSAGGSRQFDTGAVINRRATQLTMTLLADFLTLGHQGAGSYALSQDKTRLFTTAISAWLDLIANVINDQAIKPLIKMNGIDSKLTPQLRPGSLDETDLTSTGTFFSQLAPLIDKLNSEDKINLTAHLFDVVDWPVITTTAEELDKAKEEAEAKAKLEAQQMGFGNGGPGLKPGEEPPKDEEKPKIPDGVKVEPAKVEP